MLVTCHDVIPLRAHATKAPFAVPGPTLAWYRFAVSFLRRVAHVACVSEATRRDVIDLVGVHPKRTSVVFQGLNERFRPLGPERCRRARSSLPAEPKLLLHVSSGAPYKNVEGTLAATAHLRGRGVDVLLLRVGPPLNPEQRAVANDHGVLRHVVEMGSVGDERLAELYNAVDAVIFPSHWEGFGLPAAEALACGTPTVVSDCAPLLETVGDAALAAPATDPEALAAAVCRIWESPSLREQLRERGPARARRFSWRLAGEQYSQLYRRISGEAIDAWRRRRSQTA
jgi:glycosyltransferase involved in cell wall biosynthesis